ncbi:MAG: glycosyltransferase, partial [Proteobacteria bacterium]
QRKRRYVSIDQVGIEDRSFDVKLVSHSRNFGSFTAIRTGLRVAQGQYFAMMSADLQEPLELVTSLFRTLNRGEADVALAVREGRSDPPLSILLSKVFWGFYKLFVQKDMPSGGIDIFGCNRLVRNALLSMEEANTSLVGQLVWIGFKRVEIAYTRLARRHGKSAWSFSKKVKYLMDSLFSFSDFPIRFLLLAGSIGVVAACLSVAAIIYAHMSGRIEVPGYASLSVFLLLFSSFNCVGLGIVGSYVWRAYENTKKRPEFILLEET